MTLTRVYVAFAATVIALGVTGAVFVARWVINMM